MTTRTLKIDMMSRIEGDAGLFLSIRDGKLTEVKLRIFESPRFFEGMLRGRKLEEVPDITARICGICPVAYQITSAAALESGLGIQISPCVKDLRRLIYCGEWIESHMLHVHLLHLPDFLGFPDAIQMAKKYPLEVERGLRLKKLGNRIVSTVGGREVHPINIRVGGFYCLPSKASISALREELLLAVDEAEQIARWVMTLSFPDFQPDTEFVALTCESEYPMFEGNLGSSSAHSVPVAEFEHEYVEIQVEHSNSLHCLRRNGGAYQVGPMARFNLNRHRMPPRARALTTELRLSNPVLNPFQSIVVRAIETVFALEECVRIVESYSPEERSHTPYEVRAGEGTACTEAPRGICWHRYRYDDEGFVKDARIIPPTTQNLARIERDLWEFVPSRLEMSDEDLRSACERAVRNHDPCVSCSVHRLDLKVHRE